MTLLNKLEEIINEICVEKKLDTVTLKSEDYKNLHLKNDIGFDSFDLAQLTVMIEDEYDIDVFENGIVNYVGEIVDKLNK